MVLKPMRVLAGMTAEGDSELTIRQGELVMMLKEDDDGWCQAAPADAPNDLVDGVGYVPASYLIPAPPEGVILEDFRGSGPGELPLGTKGAFVWKYDDRHRPPRPGYKFVILDSGIRGAIPEASVEWVPETPGSSPPGSSRPNSQQSVRPLAAAPGSAAPPATSHLKPMMPMMVVADLKAESETELAVSRGELLVLLRAEEGGWCQAAPVDTPGDLVSSAGYVPASFLEEIPADGVIISNFRGSSEADLPAGSKGAFAWKYEDRHRPPRPGYKFVVLEGGVRGAIPEASVEWVSKTPAPSRPSSQQDARRGGGAGLPAPAMAAAAGASGSPQGKSARTSPSREMPQETKPKAKPGPGAVPLSAVPILMQILSSPAHANRDDTLTLLCDLVSSSFGEAGDALGATIREAGGMLTLSWLLADPSIEIQKQALYLIGNLASDAVDPRSYLTKRLLQQCDASPRHRTREHARGPPLTADH